MHFRPRCVVWIVYAFRLGGLHVGRLMSFGGLRVGGCLFVGKTVHMNQHRRCCTFDSAGLIERSEIYPG